MSFISEKLQKIRESIPADVKLVAVSKMNPAESVIEAMKAGQRVFGENRIQEASIKFDAVRSGGFEPELHIIGFLQRNKVKEAVRIASMIQSVDRIELADEIEKQCAKLNKTIDVLFEIHTGEDSKSGFKDETELFSVLENCAAQKHPHIKPKGFMTVAPFSDDEKIVRAAFRKVRTLFEKASAEFPALCLTELSMGMSGDYKTAVEEGSTMIRIGTAIFGRRDYSK